MRTVSRALQDWECWSHLYGKTKTEKSESEGSVVTVCNRTLTGPSQISRARHGHRGCTGPARHPWTTGWSLFWHFPLSHCRGWCSCKMRRKTWGGWASQTVRSQSSAHLQRTGPTDQTWAQHSPINYNAEVSSDGSGFGVSRVGLPQHHTAGLHSTFTFPHLDHKHRTSWAWRPQCCLIVRSSTISAHHGNHRSAAHVLDEGGEERFLLQVSVVLLQQVLTGLWEQEPNTSGSHKKTFPKHTSLTRWPVSLLHLFQHPWGSQQS